MVAKIRGMSGYDLVLVYVKISQKNQWVCKGEMSVVKIDDKLAIF
jgi:hypothetical protein